MAGGAFILLVIPHPGERVSPRKGSVHATGPVWEGVFVETGARPTKAGGEFAAASSGPSSEVAPVSDLAIRAVPITRSNEKAGPWAGLSCVLMDWSQ